MGILVKSKTRTKERNGFSNFAFEGARVLATGLLTGVGVKLGSNFVERAMSTPSRTKIDDGKIFRSLKK